MPQKSRNRSIIYDTGLLLEEISESPDKASNVWYCMVTEECRQQFTATPRYAGIKAANTSNATRHLSEVHGEFGVASVGSQLGKLAG